MILEFLQSILVLVPRPLLSIMQIPYRMILKALMVRVPNWRYPPGPLANWIPKMGSLVFFFGSPSFLVLTKLAKKFGKIYRLKLGDTTTIVISDPALLRETFCKEVFSGRSMPSLMDVMNKQGVIHAEGALLRNQRNFLNRILSNITDCKHSMYNVYVDRALSAMKALVGELESYGGQPTNYEAALSFAITNMFFSTVVGTVFSRDDDELAKLIEYTHDSYRNSEVISVVHFFPVLATYGQHQESKQAVLDRKESFINYMRPIVEKHRRELDREHPKDLIDAFLVEMLKTNDEQSQFFTESQLYAVLGDLFSTSLETINSTIQWLIRALVRQPPLQDKLYEELKVVDDIPKSGCLLDKLAQMPFVEATILEGLRYSSIMPIGVTHRALEKTIIDGYRVPKDSMIVGLFWKIHQDPKLWKNDPTEFNPTNHLNNQGLVERSDNLMPFSTGLRSCPAELISMEMITHIFVNLVHAFKMERGSDSDHADLTFTRNGILREPFPFATRFNRR